MNADEIVKALRLLCGADGTSCTGNCSPCPANQFRSGCPSEACDDGTMSAAADLIESLQAQLAAKDAEIERLRAEPVAGAGNDQAVKADDPVNHPSHYTAGGVECIDGIRAAVTGLSGFEAYCTGNAIKYLWRWRHKGGAEDLRKAQWYIDRLLEGANDR